MLGYTMPQCELSLMQNDVVKLAHELNEVKSGELDG